MGHLALQAVGLLLLAALGCCWGRPDPGTSSCNAFQQAVCGEKCIPFTWLCNGEKECPDGSDEHCEVECRGDSNAWQCKDGKCIAAAWFCDGTSDCMDASDEENCVCAEKKVPCQDHVQCINRWEICDEHKDCVDGSDEANCPTTNCLDGQWQCQNKVCIMEDWKCNGVNNCGDSSDEGNCAYCPQGMISCDKGKCILGSLICNGVEDCLDDSDEPRTCGKNCSLDNGGCTKKCTDTSWGVRCSCDPGWNLQPDGQTCVDVDECALAYGPCSQLCNNTVGSFTCSCVKGYRLSSATTCEVAVGATKILLASNQELVLLDTSTLHVVGLVPTRTTLSSIAYDLLKRTYYWVEEGKQLHIQMPGKHEILYPDVGAINSISVDWFTGQLYWASNSPPAICAGLSDGRGYVKILEKKLMPEQLTVFPGKKYMYWVNHCKKGRTTIEAAGMDGSDRHLLAVATAEEPVGLALDYITGRLYWISAYKKSIETIKVDGTGRYTFPEMMLRVQNPLGLAVFENRFFWADKEHLLSASCMSSGVSSILLNSSISAFTVLHELQQPLSDTLACAPGLCSHICLLSPVHPKGYKCACPDGTFLLPSGKCAELKILFSTGMVIYLLQVSSKGIVMQHTPIQEWPVHIYFQDMDWSRGLIYWTDDEGELMRFNKETKAKVIIPTIVPVCLASVDVPSGDLYWLACDRIEIKVTTFAGMMTKTLYHSKDSILHLFLDWQRTSLYWLESGKPIQRMALDGSNVNVVWNETWTEDIPVALDTSSSSFFWSSKDMVLKMLNLNTHKIYSLKESWTYGVAATYGPYLVTFNKTALVVWNRSMEPSAINILDVQKVVIILDTDLETVQSVPVRKPMVASTTVLTTSISAAVLPKTTIHVTTVPSSTTSTTPPTTSTTTSTATVTATTATATASKTTVVIPLVCGWAEIPCRNGIQCVTYEYVCDGEDDCMDGSDEDVCVEFCNNPGVFKCQSGKCIHERHRCDGIKHCADGSDESDCWVPTPECALRCDHNRCVPEFWLCDGTPDCFDSTDEQGCAQKECGPLEFRCRSGQCVSYFLHCDGDYDCKDHSDEEGCPVPVWCQGNEMKCNNGECIQKDWLCDGDIDCKDGSDEQDCRLPELTCDHKQWRCNSARQCVPDLWHCDGEVDCKDGSDETGCEPRKCRGYEFQCSQTCINYTLVCNGRWDCQSGLDEGRNCDMPCRRSCSHICYRSPNGPKCACPEGYILSRDRRTCRDINECKELANEEKCSQTCINTHGGYTCTCHPGYLMEPDGHTCKVVGSEPKLLVAVQFDLIIYGLRSMKEDVLLTTDRKMMIFSIDYDLVEQKVFWMDLNTTSIKWLDMKINQTGTLVKGIKSDSIAVDWIGRVLYWTDGSQGKLLATQLNGSWKENPEYTVVLDEDMGQPQSLALHPLDGLMYWSEIGSEPQIEQAGMDGSNRKILIDTELGWPTTITLDLLSWKIFWMDDKLHCIGSASLDGTRIKVFQLTEIHTPFAVSVFEDYIYWSEMKTKTIRRVNKRTGKNTAVLIKRHGQPHGLRLMHEVLQQRSSNPCASSGCSHLCLLNPNKGGSCRCPVGLVLSENEKTCIPMKESAFVFLVDQINITQVYLKMLHFKEGQVTFPENRTFLLTNIDHLTVMDYSLQDSALYFSELKDNSIKMLTFKDPEAASWKVVTPVEGTVVSLALDWLSGNIYWIDDKHPYIQVATADGRYRYVVVKDGLYQPNYVVLHPPSAAMCMIDLGMKSSMHGPKLECASMDGSKRRILWKKFQTPVGLTIVDAGARLFWADQATGTVESIQMDGSQFRVVRKGLHDLSLFTVGGGIMFWTTVAHNGLTKVWYSKLDSRESSWFQGEQNLVAIKIYSKLTQQGSNGCSENNGGCSHICLPVPLGRNCKCATGYYLVHGNECTRALRCLAPLQACKDSSKCIARQHVCDGSADCLDGSDEASCTYIGKKPQSTVSSWTTQLQTKLLTTVKATVRKPMTWGRPTSTGPKAKLSTTQKWEHRTQTWTQEVVRSGLDSLPCSSETCNMRGECTVEGNKVKCMCAQGYSGDHCEEEANSAAGAIVLSTIAILLVSMVAAGAYIYLKKRQTRQRFSSASSFRTLTLYHKDIEPEAEGKFVEDETCINEAYDPEHVEDDMFLSEAYNPEHVEDETYINKSYDPERKWKLL